jgi:formylglycine-generating enzyme required for sulfatase activity
MMANKRIFHTPKILSDLPVGHSDPVSFNFNDFAYTLARLIAAKETKTPLVIGVSGTWGAGKTSLMRMLQQMLQQTESLNSLAKSASIEFANENEPPQAYFRACKTVWFNAWKYAEEDELLVALVRVIVQGMTRDKALFDQVAGQLLDPAYPRHEVVRTVFSWFSIKVTGVDLKSSTAPMQEVAFAEKTAVLDLFDEAFEHLLAAWVHHSLEATTIDPQKGVLVVFIDDLDRCLPAKTVQMLEAVKLFLEKRGCVFVLGAESDLLREAVEEHYKSQQSDDYLEKIIQLRFDLPPIPDSEMGKYVETQSADPELTKHWKVISAGAELNPRKVKTFLNDINLAWALLRNTGKAHDGVKDDFVRWQALMRAAPDAFKKKIFEMDDSDLRFNYVQDALQWAKGGEDAKPLESYFDEYNKTPRLRRTLKAIAAFGPDFDASMLNDFLHLSAPPPPVMAGTPKVPAEVRQDSGILEIADGLPRGEPEMLPRRAPAHGTSELPARPGSESRILTLLDVEFVKIQAGKFLMGSKDDEIGAYDDEKPQHTVDIPYDYLMGRFPITNKQYARFAQSLEKKHPVSAWEKKPDHPVVNVSWFDVQENVQWLNAQAQSEGLSNKAALRLPTEAEWERAVRGAYGSRWPWGNEFDQTRCNSSEGKKGGTTPVGAYSPAGDSPYGCIDMAGNVWEWTQSLYKEYPYRYDERESLETPGNRVFRGGAFNNAAGDVRAAVRLGGAPDRRYDFLGFRVLASPILQIPK